MAEPADRLRALEDRAAIADLIASYGPLADSGDANGVSRLWTEEGEYHVGGFGVARGQAEIAVLIEGATHRELMAQGCAHVLAPHRIALSGDTAQAYGYSIVFRCTDGSFAPWRVSANRWQFVRTSIGWKVSRRENAPLDGSEAARALLTMIPAG